MSHYLPASRRPSAPADSSDTSTTTTSPPLPRVSSQPPQLGLNLLDHSASPTSSSAKAFKLIGLSPSPSPEGSSAALPSMASNGAAVEQGDSPVRSRRRSAAHDALLDWTPESSTAGSSPDPGRRAVRESNREGKLASLLGLPAEPSSSIDLSLSPRSTPTAFPLSASPTPSTDTPVSPGPSLPSSSSANGSLASRKHGRRTSLSIGFGLGFGALGKSSSADKDSLSPTTAAAPVTSPIASTFKRSISGRQGLNAFPPPSSSGSSSASSAATPTHGSVMLAPNQPSHGSNSYSSSASTYTNGRSGTKPSSPLHGSSASSSSRPGLSSSRSSSSVATAHGRSESFGTFASSSATTATGFGWRGSESRESTSSASGSRRGSASTTATVGRDALSSLVGSSSGKGKDKEGKHGGGGGGSMKDLVGFLRWGGRGGRDKEEAVEHLKEEDEDEDEAVGGRGALAASLGPLPRFQPRSAVTSSSGGGLARSHSTASSSSRSLLASGASQKGAHRRPAHLVPGAHHRATPSPSPSLHPPSPTYIYTDSFDDPPTHLYPRPPGLSQPDLLLAHALWVSRTLSPNPPPEALAAASPAHRLFYVPPGEGTVREEREKWESERRGQGWSVERKLDWWFETGERVPGWDFDQVIASRLAEPAHDQRRRPSARTPNGGGGTIVESADELQRSQHAAAIEADRLSPRSSTASFAASQSSFATSLLTTPTGYTIPLDQTLAPRKDSAGGPAEADPHHVQQHPVQSQLHDPPWGASKGRLAGVGGQAARDRRRDSASALGTAPGSVGSGAPRRPSRTPPVGPIAGPAVGLPVIDGRF